MHKCNYALFFARPLIIFCEAPRQLQLQFQVVKVEFRSGLTESDAIRLLFLILVLILLALFAAQRLQLDAIGGGHFVIPFRHIATAEATT